METEYSSLRVARATKDLVQITQMYQKGLGLLVLGNFKNHDGYSGVMLGQEGCPYHFEFTWSDDEDFCDQPSEEDLLVFYIPDADQWASRCLQMERAGFLSVRPKNPYWGLRGKTFRDMDGRNIVIKNGRWPDSE